MSSTDGSRPPGLEQTANSDQIVDALPDLIFEFTEDGRYAAYHAGPRRELYASPEEFIGAHISEVLPDPVAEKFEEALQRTRNTGRETTIDYMLPTFDQLQCYECRLLPLSSGNVLAMIRNMTDCWREKTGLRDSESRYRNLVNNIPGIVYRCHFDEEWTAIFISSAVEEILEYPVEDFVEGRRSLASVIHPEDRRRVRREISEAADERSPFQLSYRMIDSNGDVHHVAERGQAVFSGDGEVAYLDGVIFDISELHQMRQRLLVNSKMAAVGNLAAGVAHEINNPLTIALANLEYAAEELDMIAGAVDDSRLGEALEDVTVAVDKIQGGIDRVRGIIDNLRTFSDAAESHAGRVDLQELVDWAVTRKVEADGTDRIDTRLESVPKVWASEIGVVQVVWNLLDNGLEAIERLDDTNGATVRVALHHNTDEVILEVADDGPGMSPDVAQRAPEPFYTTKQVGQGTGLGLFVCQGLVDGMDGELDIETALGEGTAVRVKLPALDSPNYPADAE